MAIKVITGDCRDVLATLPAAHFHTVVTSPPYFGLRDYGTDGQIGLEPSPDEFVAELVKVFREVRRVLRDDGTVWLNLGDSYASAWACSRRNVVGNGSLKNGKRADRPNRLTGPLKEKDMIGIPWRVAFALQADGWYLRQDIVWCLSGGAWVYAQTQKGEMPVMLKDLVRLDPATVKLWNGGNWTQVLGWWPSADTSERIELVLRSGERIGCTGGHIWPTQRGNVPARDLNAGDVIDSCCLPEPEGAIRPGYLIDDALWLVGLFLAEGSRGERASCLALSADEAHWLPRIAAVVEHYGGTMGHTFNGGSLNVRIWCRTLDAIIDTYVGGSGAKSKHFTNAVWTLPNDSIRLIVGGYLDGDGHADGDRVRLGFCRNYALERDIRTAAARLGAILTLKPSVAKYQSGESPSFRGEWRWQNSGYRTEKNRAEIVEVRASRARKFWDVSVEDEPHLFALASGVLTHNSKPNPMPESVRDRCTKAHEYIFLLSKAPRYFYDQAAIAEDSNTNDARRPYTSNGAKILDGRSDWKSGQPRDGEDFSTRNRRSVWTIATQPYREAHFATFPPALVEPCILAGCPKGGHVLDPFGGAGTTGLVADRLQRDATLIELNPDYAEMARKRLAGDAGMFAEVV